MVKRSIVYLHDRRVSRRKGRYAIRSSVFVLFCFLIFHTPTRDTYNASRANITVITSMVFTRIRATLSYKYRRYRSISISTAFLSFRAYICLNTFDDERFSARDTSFNSKYSFRDNSTPIIEIIGMPRVLETGQLKALGEFPNLRYRSHHYYHPRYLSRSEKFFHRYATTIAIPLQWKCKRKSRIMFDRLSTTREPLICHGHYLLPKKCYRPIRWRGNRVRETARKKDSWLEYLVDDDEIGPALDPRIRVRESLARIGESRSMTGIWLPKLAREIVRSREYRWKKKITIRCRQVARCANGKNPIRSVLSNAFDLPFDLDPAFRIFRRLFAADIKPFREDEASTEHNRRLLTHIAKTYVEEDILQLRIWLSTIVRVRVLIWPQNASALLNIVDFITDRSKIRLLPLP